MVESKKYGRDYILVDLADVPAMQKHRWHLKHKKNETMYARTTVKDAEGKPHSTSMHRMLMDTPADLEVDHKDHNGINNRRYNLRNCTGSKNQHNRWGPQKNSSTGAKCVFFESNGFTVKVGLGGKQRYIGRYPSIEKAMAAHAFASLELQGNFSQDGTWDPAFDLGSTGYPVTRKQWQRIEKLKRTNPAPCAELAVAS